MRNVAGENSLAARRLAFIPILEETSLLAASSTIRDAKPLKIVRFEEEAAFVFLDQLVEAPRTDVELLGYHLPSPRQQ